MKIVSKYISSIIFVSVFGSLLNAKSLWMEAHGQERSMFSDYKANFRGDIITVILSENFKATNGINTNTEKDSTIKNTINQFLFSKDASGFGTHNGETPATDIVGKNKYTAGASSVSNQDIEDKFSVLVIDRLPNRNLVLEGVRKITTQKQARFLLFRGIVRSKDIEADNSIASHKIADAHIEYIDEGSLSESQKKGWLQKINDLTNPF